MPPATLEPNAVHLAKAVLVLRGITIRRAAAVIGVSELTLGRQLNRWEKLTPRVRAGLAALLSLPEAQLFLEEPAARTAARTRGSDRRSRARVATTKNVSSQVARLASAAAVSR